MTIGVTSYSAAGNAQASNGGMISAQGGDYGAYGVSVQAAHGTATINNSGSVLATSTGTSIGIVAEAYGNIVVAQHRHRFGGRRQQQHGSWDPVDQRQRQRHGQ